MISPSNFNLFRSNVNTMLGAVYEQAKKELTYPKIATTVPVGEASQIAFAWTGMMPKARLWQGPRVVHEPAPQTYVVVPNPYEHTVSIDRFDLDDDKMGVYYRTLPDQTRQLLKMPDYWFRDLLEARGDYPAGPYQNGLDGLAHWNTAHPVDLYNAGAGTYCNDFTGGGVVVNGITVGGAFGTTAFSTLRNNFGTLKGEDGEPLELMAGMLMVPTMLETEARVILETSFFAPPAWGTITGQVGAADNVFRRFQVELFVNKLLVSQTKWYMMVTDIAKPFQWCERDYGQVVQRVSPTDPVMFDEHKMLAGGWGRGAPAWNFAFLSARSGP